MDVKPYYHLRVRERVALLSGHVIPHATDVDTITQLLGREYDVMIRIDLPPGMLGTPVTTVA